MPDCRPVIMGMNNPLSRKPEHALFPHPPGCAGWRLWRMLCDQIEVTRGEYCVAFDRRNVLNAREWNREDAHEAARRMLPTLRGRTVLLLGVGPRRAFGVPEKLLHPQKLHGVTWRQLPHPSGRCRWYNVKRNRRVASMLLGELYEQGRVRDVP